MSKNKCSFIPFPDHPVLRTPLLLAGGDIEGCWVSWVLRVQLFWVAQCPNIMAFGQTCAKTDVFAALMMVNVARGALLPSLCFLFVRHDVENLAIGFAHGLCTDAGEVVDSLVDAVVDDAFGRRYTLAFHREDGGEHSGVDTGGNLQRA